jgi:DNA-binding response OmpR family regulator
MAKTFEIPFIFSTSMSEKIDKVEALKLGADDYIVKPYELDSLPIMAKSWIKSGSPRYQGLLGEIRIPPIAVI